jgi:hypothetical protein
LASNRTLPPLKGRKFEAEEALGQADRAEDPAAEHQAEGQRRAYRCPCRAYRSQAKYRISGMTIASTQLLIGPFNAVLVANRADAVRGGKPPESNGQEPCRGRPRVRRAVTAR